MNKEETKSKYVFTIGELLEATKKAKKGETIVFDEKVRDEK